MKRQKSFGGSRVGAATDQGRASESSSVAVPGRRLLLALALACLLAVPAAQAAVSLSVRLVRGGMDLDFGTVDPTRPPTTAEVELALTNSGGGRYRVYQELPGLLVSEQGRRLPEGALLMQLSRGMTGTLSTSGIVPVTGQAQELFVSGAGGGSDTVVVAYTVQPEVTISVGSYRGIIRYTVESVETGSHVTETLTVRLTVPAVVEIERLGASPGRLEFGSVGLAERSQPIALDLLLLNNAGAGGQLIQEVLEPLATGTGEHLAGDALQVALSTAGSEQAWQPVGASPLTLLTDAGQASRQVSLAYAMTVPVEARAGEYRGLIRLRLVPAGGLAARELRLPVTVRVPDVFSVSVEPMDGSGGALDFGRTPTSHDPVERAVTVHVTSNMGRAYQVLAGLEHPLVLPSGQELPAGALTWLIPEVAHGTPLIAERAAVPVGYAPVYESDATGTADSFTLQYRLDVPADAPDGVYTGQVRFSVTIF